MNTDQPELPAERCIVCGGPEPCSHDFDKMQWPQTPQPDAKCEETGFARPTLETA